MASAASSTTAVHHLHQEDSRSLYDYRHFNGKSSIHVTSLAPPSTLSCTQLNSTRSTPSSSRASTVRGLLNRIGKAIPNSMAEHKHPLHAHTQINSSLSHTQSLHPDSEQKARCSPNTSLQGYNRRVEKLRKTEYPDLKGRTYVDNAGTQLPAKSLIDAFAKDLANNIYGNPHTHSYPARNSAGRVTAVRRRVLEFFHANPEDFELVFVANASAAIKLVGEAMSDYVSRCNEEKSAESTPTKLWYGFHKDAHNSLIGLREITKGNQRCFVNDAEVDDWIHSSVSADENQVSLFAYPGQSNLTGRRLPLRWAKEIKAKHSNTFTLLDAAGLATTKQLELDQWQPDFTAVSFYKIFGFPDLGALIVRKSSAHVLANKKYFAGGTVDAVSVIERPFMLRRGPLHEQLEEGTLPFHNIIALDHALTVHEKLFESMERISQHVCGLTAYCAEQLNGLHYTNGQPLCEIYTENSTFGDADTHGGTVALNLYRSDGSMIKYRSVERAADAAHIYVRSGAACNPGGMATYLGWTLETLEALFAAGMRCSDPIEIYDGKWTGVVRVSFGANSVKADVDALVRFLKEVYLHGAEGRPVGSLDG